MKHISLLVPHGDSSFSNLEATYKMFNMANGFLQKQGQPPVFDVRLVGTTTQPRRSNGVFAVTPDTGIDDVSKTDLIIIPAIHGDYKQVVAENQGFIKWIVKQYNNGAEVASLCIGAFLLAETGLLHQQNCTTHWMAAKEFQEMYPTVKLVSDRIITDENRIYTSGGAYSSLNLNLYLVEKFAGRETAVLSSKIFEIDINRNSQAPFIIFNGQKNHTDQNVLKAQDFIETNYREKLSVSAISGHVNLSIRSLERRFRRCTGNTVVEYIQRIKTEAAKKELEKGEKPVSEIMYEVGYNDGKAFRAVFKKHTGMTPNYYRSKYQKISGTV